MDESLEASAAPQTLTTGGISRRWAAVLLLIPVLVAAAVVWLSNIEPIRVDTTAMGIRPFEMVADSVAATAPDGTTFTQYTIPLRDGEEFSFLFWLHNDSPFPVAVTDAGNEITWGASAVDVRMGPASGGESPSGTLPYTIPARDYAAIEVRVRLRGCLDETTFNTLGLLPVSFRMFGVVSRSTVAEMPMTIQVTGPTGLTCPSGP